MNYGFKYGFGGKNSLSPPAQTCVNMGDDGTWYGYEYNNFGSATPDKANDGTLLYSFKFNPDGLFIVAWGDAGDSRVQDAYTLVVNNDNIALWDNTTNTYNFNNQDLATRLIDEYNNNNKDFCTTILGKDMLVIEYDYMEVHNAD